MTFQQKVEFLKDALPDLERVNPYNIEAIDRIKSFMHKHGIYKAPLCQIVDESVINAVLAAQGKKKQRRQSLNNMRNEA